MKSWLLRRPDSAAASQVLVVYYEDMLADLRKEVDRINAFLTRDFSSSRCSEVGNKTTVCDTPLDIIYEQVTFAYMKNHMDRFQPLSVGWKPGYQFIRKGEKGDYKQLFSAEHVERYQASVEKEFPVDVLRFKPSYLGP